jgi:two-component system cell cycle response regulator DivK
MKVTTRTSTGRSRAEATRRRRFSRRAPERPLTIVVVDDERDTREMYAAQFTAMGARVVVAANGLEGLKLVSSYHPDVLLLDLSMPEMTGWEVAETLRRDPTAASTAIVALTGYAFSGAHAAALKSGVDLYLTKPCLPHVAYELIVDLLRGAHAADPPRGTA